MKLDSNTRIKITNKRTNEFGFYSPSYLVIPAGLEKMMESMMTDTVETGKIIKDILSSANTDFPLKTGVVISRACLYLAVCCYIDKTESCKSIINTIVDTYDISIDNSKDPR